MIDRELASELQPMLCVVIATLIEDDHDDAVTMHPLDGYGPLAERLKLLGSDIATLAAAMSVIARRTEGTGTKASV